MQPHPAIVTEADLDAAMDFVPAPRTCREERAAYFDLAFARLCEMYGSQSVRMAVETRTLPVEMLSHLDQKDWNAS